MLIVNNYQSCIYKTQGIRASIIFGANTRCKSIKKNLSLYNPFSETFSHGEVDFDMNKPKIFTLKNKNSDKDLIVKYDPKIKGNLTSRITGKKVPVAILETKEKDLPNEAAFIFMSKDLLKEYGFVHLHRPKMVKDHYSGDLLKDYPKEGIVGDRLIVEYLCNETNGKLKGVGKLADEMEVKYCLDNNIKPNIISYAKINTEVAHYKRGKRFIEPEKDTYVYKELMRKYKTADMNKIVRKFIKEDNEKTCIQGFYYPTMYMPKELFNKYKKKFIKNKTNG